MKQIKYIIIHCSDSPDGIPNTIQDIDEWHKVRKFNRRSEWVTKFNSDLHHVGYQYVIHIDGVIYSGRHEQEIGAHAQSYNSNSIGICLIGKGKFTPMQWESLKQLVSSLQDRYQTARVIGHYKVAQKTCPNFDVEDWMINGKSPPEEKILVV